MTLDPSDLHTDLIDEILERATFADRMDDENLVFTRHEPHLLYAEQVRMTQQLHQLVHSRQGGRVQS